MSLTKKNTPDFQKNLLNWYLKNKRDLPFRHTKDPYKIWLSETMLQQTVVAAVLDHYDRFLKKFPTLPSVAQAKTEELLHLWQGLGYYSRIRNFQIACQQIVKDFESKVPQTYEELKTLKGIGDYTAAAISSICFEKPHAVIDGNVKRVISRLFDFREDIDSKEAKQFFFETANALLNTNHAGDHNQAMMELGATICRPNPSCLICTVNSYCAAKNKNPENLPVKKKQKFIEVEYHALLLSDDNQILLKKPFAENLIADMWELPFLYKLDKLNPLETWQSFFKNQLQKNKFEKLGTVKHSITNKKITTIIYRHPLIKLKHPQFQVLQKEKLDQISVNTLSTKILRKYFL